MDIAAKLADALSMFWQSLDDRERRLIVIGCAYLAAVVLLAPVEKARRERERSEIVEAVARRLEGQHGH